MLAKAKKANALLSTALPFGVFIIAGWYGLSTIVQTKRDLRIATKGLDALEELDPVERMRQRYGLDSNNQRSLGAKPVSSLEEELQTMQQTLDISSFEYKPVPRTEDE